MGLNIKKWELYFKDKLPKWMKRSALWIVTSIKMAQTKRKIRTIIRENRPVSLEIGAGEKKGDNGWVTLDQSLYCDLVWDLRRGIPFPDSSVLKLYSSHLFEHLTFKQITQLLGECRRVLIPNGVFSIAVPNARLYVEAYMNNDKSFDQNHSEYYSFTGTPIDSLNYVAYMGTLHKYMFDPQNMIAILSANGFKDAHVREFDPEIDMENRQKESFYAEAVCSK